MTTNVPSFIDSPYLIIDEKGWRLQDDAPAELKKEFEEYMNSLNLIHEQNPSYDHV
jgi:hypothetical protein